MQIKCMCWTRSLQNQIFQSHSSVHFQIHIRLKPMLWQEWFDVVLTQTKLNMGRLTQTSLFEDLKCSQYISMEDPSTHPLLPVVSVLFPHMKDKTKGKNASQTLPATYQFVAKQWLAFLVSRFQSWAIEHIVSISFTLTPQTSGSLMGFPIPRKETFLQCKGTNKSLKIAWRGKEKAITLPPVISQTFNHSDPDERPKCRFNKLLSASTIECHVKINLNSQIELWIFSPVKKSSIKFSQRLRKLFFQCLNSFASYWSCPVHYWKFTQPLSWDEASTVCQSVGAQLPSFSSRNDLMQLSLFYFYSRWSVVGQNSQVLLTPLPEALFVGIRRKRNSEVSS